MPAKEPHLTNVTFTFECIVDRSGKQFLSKKAHIFGRYEVLYLGQRGLKQGVTNIRIVEFIKIFSDANIRSYHIHIIC